MFFYFSILLYKLERVLIKLLNYKVWKSRRMISNKSINLYLQSLIHYDIIIHASKPDNRCYRDVGEESPSSAGQGCWITPSGGNSKESATEIYRQRHRKVYW